MIFRFRQRRRTADLRLLRILAYRFCSVKLSPKPSGEVAGLGEAEGVAEGLGLVRESKTSSALRRCSGRQFFFVEILFDLIPLFFDFGGDFRLLVRRDFSRFEAQPLRSVIHGEEKQDAGKKIQPQWMDVADAFAADKFICEPPRSGHEKADDC